MLMLLLCVVGWEGNEDENLRSISREENNIFIIFQQLQTHTYEAVSFSHPLLPLFLFIYSPGCCSLSRAWVIYRCHSCSWNFLFLEFYPHALYVQQKSIKIYGNVGNIIQFSVFMAHFNPHSSFFLTLTLSLLMLRLFAPYVHIFCSLLFICRNQTLVKL